MKKTIQKFLAMLATAATCFAGSSLATYAAPQDMGNGVMFDPEYYAENNQDVVQNLGTDDPGMMFFHYINCGINEGRLPYETAVNEQSTTTTTEVVTQTTQTTQTVNIAGPGAYLTDAKTVYLSAALSTLPASDDGVISVYALAPSEYAIAADRQAIATTAISQTPAVSFALPENGLYLKYVFAVTTGGQKTAVANASYILNPELLATNNVPRVAYPTKAPLGTFANYNIDTDVGLGGVINAATKIVQFNNNGFDLTGPCRHPWSYLADSHPVDEGPFQYMMNTVDMAGVMTIANQMHYVAANCTAQDYIIGNEVNVRKWSYIAYVDPATYVRQYVQEFRVAYNAIKSANANARVFICIDQNWDRNHPASYWEHYVMIDNSDFLPMFMEQIKEEGNIDWNVAIHPHTVPLTWAKFWDLSGSGAKGTYESMINSNKMISFQNLGVLTNFLAQPAYLNTSGQVRTVLATEVGLSAGQGADAQAAAIVAAYYAVLRNPYVDTIVINQDASTNCIFTAQAQAVYDSMDGADAASIEAWAKSVIGISDWSQVLR